MRVTDRSRYFDGTGFCPRFRWLKYESFGGQGLEPKKKSVPLSTGQGAHNGIEKLLVGASPQEAAHFARTEYLKQVKEAGFLGVEEGAHVVDEQAWFIESVTHAYARQCLPSLLAEFEILAVEHEEGIILGCTCGLGNFACEVEELVQGHIERGCEGLLFQSRPDFIARELSTGNITVHDFKTAYALGDDWTKGFANSIQLSLGCAAVERRLGVPVRNYYTHGILKGGRQKFKKKGMGETPHKHQYSDLCYAKIVPPSPGLSKQPQVTHAGYWIDRPSVWDNRLLEPVPAGMTKAEYYVSLLSQETLYSLFVMAGPYSIQDYLVREAIQEIGASEDKWAGLAERLASEQAVYESFEEVLGSPTLQRDAPRSWNCNDYFKSDCPMIPICWKHAGWERPLESGLFVARVPHHTPEANMRASMKEEVKK